MGKGLGGETWVMNRFQAGEDVHGIDIIGVFDAVDGAPEERISKGRADGEVSCLVVSGFSERTGKLGGTNVLITSEAEIESTEDKPTGGENRASYCESDKK